MQINIRNAVGEDALRINEINRDSWAETYANDALGLTRDFLLAKKQIDESKTEKTKEYIKNASAYFVAEVDGIVRGFAAPRKDDLGRNRLGGTYVEPGFTGKGIGSMLLEKVFEFYKGKGDIYLEVAEYNEGAIRFYKRHGFELVDKKAKKHMIDDERYIPVLLMVRKDPSV